MKPQRIGKNDVLAWLEKQGSRRNVAGMARYGIVAKRVFGVPIKTLLVMQKRLGTDHAMAAALWASGWYEARLLAAFVDDPARVTRGQMNAWAASFENWADCDTVCFHLFDRTPFAWEKARQWSASSRLFVKRAAFALMACLALHDKAAPDEAFLAFLPLIERGAGDERNFVKKSVSWALRAIGRRSARLHVAARAVATRLGRSEHAAPRWVGKDALRDLAKARRKAR
ncbi:MAG TPA: DNA alkylation repair protein [Gemmatimonadales bacterium]